MNNRASAVVIQNGRVLLMKRRRNNDEYYILPGGSIEPGETPEVAAVRELQEEMTITGTVERKLFDVIHEDFNGRRESAFLIANWEGTPTLGGPELQRHSETNSYTPTWVPISELSSLKTYPRDLGQRLMELAI